MARAGCSPGGLAAGRGRAPAGVEAASVPISGASVEKGVNGNENGKGRDVSAEHLDLAEAKAGLDGLVAVVREESEGEGRRKLHRDRSRPPQIAPWERLHERLCKPKGQSRPQTVPDHRHRVTRC